MPATCLSAGKNGLSIKTNSDSGKDKFLWKWQTGSLSAAQGDFGDPVNGSPVYTLCVYDSTGGSPVFAMGLNVGSGGTCDGKPCWKAISDKGWSYKNKTGSAAGITKVKFKSGAAGKPSLFVAGRGAALPLPAPVSATEFFDQDSSVTVQLHGSAPAMCWSSTFAPSATKKNDAATFKALAP